MWEKRIRGRFEEGTKERIEVQIIMFLTCFKREDAMNAMCSTERTKPCLPKDGEEFYSGSTEEITFLFFKYMSNTVKKSFVFV